MTYKEAITTCDMACDECKRNHIFVKCIGEKCANYLKKKALEKQIPKKPLSKIEDADTCPNCKEFILLDDWGNNYCKHCGQALYWRGKQ